MRKAAHALLDLKIDIYVRVYFAFQIVMFDHLVWEVRKLELHVFITFHRGIEVEIIDVN